jgi:uncharacterized membrane protein YqjE
MSKLTPWLRHRAILLGLISAAPLGAWAGAGAGPSPTTLAAVLVGLVGLLVLAAWLAVRDYRLSRPGVTLPYAGLLGLAAITAHLNPWGGALSGLLMGYVGLGGWLLALKHLRLGPRAAGWWTVAGLIGFGWLVTGLQGVLMPHYNYADTRANDLAWLWQLLVGGVGRVLGWVPLTRRLYARRLPAEAGWGAVGQLSLRAAALTLAAALVLMLPVSISLWLHHPTGRRAGMHLLSLSGSPLLVLLTMLAVGGWQLWRRSDPPAPVTFARR